MINNNKKDKASSINNLKKILGESLKKLNDVKTAVDKKEYISFHKGIDKFLGIPGFPRGWIIEIFGMPGSGKTSLCLNILEAAHWQDFKTLFIDGEYGLYDKYCDQLGLNWDYFYILQPTSAEHALQTIITACTLNCFKIIVLDSVTSLLTMQDHKQKIGQFGVASLARIMSKSLLKLLPLIQSKNILILFINQFWYKMNNFTSFGAQNKTTTGGIALSYYSSIWLEVKPFGLIKSGENVLGKYIKFILHKSKFSHPKMSIFPFIYGKGFDYTYYIIEQAILKKIITISGAWYKFNNESIANGKIKLMNYFSNQDKLKWLIDQIKKYDDA